MPKTPGYTRTPRGVSLREVPADLYNALAAEAAQAHRSLAGHILFILEQHVAREQSQQQQMAHKER